ncbi:unnamed protein product [Spirodela intermedia]|uniref:Uncharacterized protein n=1 Tax=Spirodela intermedia TaxID=51605 RepID=A0A7I8JPI0_SPIIN|nr:unnamed protein product [Spirodela intermedia]CAA6671661.1 unnamed protein product [Spirodela intermedia]
MLFGVTIYSKTFVIEILLGGIYDFRFYIGAYNSERLQNQRESIIPHLNSILLKIVMTDHPKIQRESKLYKILWFGVESDYNVLVMDLLGPSLEDSCHQLEYVHRKSLSHRNIKPKNFSWKFIDTNTHQHISYRENKSLKRTGRYASKNAHHGREQGRRDDLESLGYVLMYLLRGSLPWEDLKGGTKDKNMKKSAMCRGYLIEFTSYFHYYHSIHFDDKPDYAYLREIFCGLFKCKRFQFDYVFDWTTLKYRQCKYSKELACVPVSWTHVCILHSAWFLNRRKSHIGLY